MQLAFSCVVILLRYRYYCKHIIKGDSNYYCLLTHVHTFWVTKVQIVFDLALMSQRKSFKIFQKH